MTPPRLTPAQKEKLGRLEPRLRDCARFGDYNQAKEIFIEIDKTLRPTGHQTRLLKAKNYLFESALETGETANLELAISGFSGVRQRARSGTRIWLEATALLGVCYVRKRNLEQAKIFLKLAVLHINSNITSQAKRTQFHERLLKRLDEECILANLMCLRPSQLNVDEIQSDAVKLLAKSPEEIEEVIGRTLPAGTIGQIESMRNFYIGQVSSADRKLLACPKVDEKPREAGKQINAALKRVIWRAVCCGIPVSGDGDSNDNQGIDLFQFSQRCRNC